MSSQIWHTCPSAANIRRRRFSFSRNAGRSSAWLERLVGDQEVAGSIPVAPIYIALHLSAEVDSPSGQRTLHPLNAVET